MKFSMAFVALTFTTLPFTTFAVTIAYDPKYDNASNSLTTVACSDGANGLITRGYSTFGSLPSFPHIGAAAAVAGWNSSNCGTCWQLSYTNKQGAQKTINMAAIDHAGAGFNTALAALNELTGGQGIQLGRVEAKAIQVPSHVCGL